jgi:hypothetical protein
MNLGSGMTTSWARLALLLVAIGCAPPKAKPRVESTKAARVGSSVVFRALEPDAKNTGPRLQAPCPVDLSRDVTCPAPSAVVEVVFSNDGRVARSRISRSSGIQALDLGCMLATNSCVVGQSSQQAALECSLQCE